MIRKPFYLLCCALIALIAGCSFQSTDLSYPSQMDVEVQTAPKGIMDEETGTRSRILHSFLAGQLSYVHDDFAGALKHFELASELLEQPSPQVHAVLAELYLKDRELEKARAEIEQALSADKENIQYQLLYAGILESLDEFSLAEKQYKATLEQDKSVTEPYLLLASLYGRQERFDDGIGILKKFSQLQPKSQVVYDLLGRFYEMKGKFKSAEKSYTESMKIGGLSGDLFASLTRVYLKQDKNLKVKQLAEKMLDVDPKHPIAQRILGELAISEGSVDEGLSYLRRAHQSIEGEKIAGDSEELRFRIALLELERQNYKAAERELLLLIARHPEHAEANYYLASIYAGSSRAVEALELLGNIRDDSEMYTKARTFAAFILRQEKRYDEAAKSLIDVLEREPKNLKARSYLVLILRDNDQSDEALDYLEEGLEYYPDDERLLFQTAVILHDTGEEDEALEQMEKVLKVNPENSDALNFVAYSLAEESRDLDRAEKLVQKALQLRNQDSFYLDTYGWILYKKGDYTKSEEILQKAVKLSEEDSVVLEHYGDVLVKNGKTDKAIAIYQRAIEALSTSTESDRESSTSRVQEKIDLLREAQ